MGCGILTGGSLQNTAHAIYSFSDYDLGALWLVPVRPRHNAYIPPSLLRSHIPEQHNAFTHFTARAVGLAYYTSHPLIQRPTNHNRHHISPAHLRRTTIIITQLGGGSIYNFSGSHSHCADFCLNQFEFGKLLEIIILAKHLDSLTTKIIKYHLTV